MIEWAWVYENDPWGGEADDFRAALVACTVANSAAFRKGRPFRISEFMPRRGASRRQRGGDLGRQMEMLAVMTLATGGHVDQQILDKLKE